MLRIPGMPLLPGTLFRDVSKSNYPKPQSLMTVQGIGMLNDRQNPGLVDDRGGPIDLSCPPVETASIYPPRTGPKLPAWVVFDKQVLCFHAYFKQTLQEFCHAPYQVRKVKICYFLEDGTLEISEPKTPNSGLVQGCILHRQRVPRPPPCQEEFMTMLDLNVDTTVQIFDRHYHITSCDKFTRFFLNRHGISVPDPVAVPEDPYEASRNQQAVRQFNQPEKKHPFAQFLKYDRQVLRFKGYWDDRSEFGDVRKLEICFFLADETVEIREKFPRNSGREGPKTFLKRGRLPRNFEGLQVPGQMTAQTLLNVLGTNPRNVRYCVDRLNTGNKEIAYYGERDFQIGTVINIYGRSVVITDFDQYTKDFYTAKYGITDFKPLSTPTRSDECTDFDEKERVFPPFNGWGSYEDSMQNCISVMPKPQQADFKKFIKFDRFVLRFGAKMLSTIKENCERIFIISYYLSDDTLQIFEIAVRNSGFLGGEFMKRRRLELPGQEKFSSKTPIYYKPYNFYIGATLSLKDFIFHIVSADDYTLIFMENHPDEYPYADFKFIMGKVRKFLEGKMRDFLSKCVPDCPDILTTPGIFLGYDSLKSALIAMMGDEISDHEIITICRYYSAEKPFGDACERDVVRAAAFLEIKRTLWNGRDDLIEHFHHINPSNSPFISETKLRSAIRGCRLPFSIELVDSILSVLNRNDCGDFEVCDLMNFIDIDCGKSCDRPPVNIAFELCPKIPFLTKGRTVNFSCFLRDLGLKMEEDPPPPQKLPTY